MEMFAFLEYGNKPAPLSHLIELLLQASAAEGFDYVAYSPLNYEDERCLNERASPWLFCNYPSSWRSFYTGRQYYNVDPTLIHAPLIGSAFYWKWLPHLLRLSPIELTILQETDEAGLNCGLSIPMYRSRSRIAILCFASSTENLFNAEATLGRLITIGAQFQAALEFSDQTLRQPRTLQRLSSREIECLNWTGRGKSSWEVAKILHISEATVNFHLKNIMKKLGAINRTAALAAAISLDLIDARTVTFTRKQAECAGGRDVNGTGHRLHARSQWSVRRDGSGRRTTKGADDQRAARCASFQQDSQPFANQGAKPDHE